MNWTPAINHQSTLPNSSSSSGLIKTDVKSNFPLTTPTVPIQSQHPQHNHHHQQQSISSNIVKQHEHNPVNALKSHSHL
ncbi:unnamed protein product [Trichobilharzia regenti]|nr:unnamed protein product [Trichobilharzia regenti]